LACKIDDIASKLSWGCHSLPRDLEEGGLTARSLNPKSPEAKKRLEGSGKGGLLLGGRGNRGDGKGGTRGDVVLVKKGGLGKTTGGGGEGSSDNQKKPTQPHTYFRANLGRYIMGPYGYADSKGRGGGMGARKVITWKEKEKNTTTPKRMGHQLW